MKELKVSAKYWQNLNEPGRRALSDLAYKYGVRYSKRVITLALKYFPTFTDIAPLSYYKPNLPTYFTAGVFLIIDENSEILGTIHKRECIGVSERVNQKIGTEYREIWHN